MNKSSKQNNQAGGAEMTVARRVKAIVSGSIGNLVEWYDWYAYSTFPSTATLYSFPSTSDFAIFFNSLNVNI